MRELKFRVWDGSKMVYDVMVGRFGAFYVNPGSKGNGLDENDSASISPFNTRYPDGTPIMEFTGLVDDNGVEIWEGDIVKMPSWSYPVEVIKTVFRPRFCCQLKGGVNDFIPPTSLVIGNKYENPELLLDK